ncbi:MAG: polymer-forming cytoskeletal protein [Syntrophorhabdales bacterium]
MIFRKRQQSLEVILGPECRVVGTLSSPGVVRIDGNVEGNITADWLIIGETGYVKGDTLSRGIIVSGRLEGNIRSNETVEIGSKGIVNGDIYTTKLSIYQGACFDGHSYMRRMVELDSRQVVPFQERTKQGLVTTKELGGFDDP